MKAAEHKSHIVFLSVPESLRGQIETVSRGHHHRSGFEQGDHESADETDEEESGSEPAFSIDPAIPIPVELPPGEISLELEQLSWEMILSGMIRVIVEHTENAAAGNLSAEDIDYYRRFVLAVRPDILEEFTEAAILKARNGDFDPALEIMDALKGLFPGSPEALLNRALILENRAEFLEQAGHEEEAEAEYEPAHEAYKELLALTPPFPDGFFNAGFFFMKRRNFSKAREYFSAYLALEGNVQEQLPREKKERAQEIVREIESHNLDDALFREAYDFVRLGEEQKGLEKIRIFLQQHPRVWNGWFILGWGLRRLSRWEDAAAAFAKVLELGGDNSDTRNELAICLMEQGDYRAARKELETALWEEPENVKIISNLGVLALRNGNRSEAAAFFRTVLELDQDDPMARKFLTGNGEG
jgi:tetratricopeptide (TPR) repeat protein